MFDAKGLTKCIALAGFILLAVPSNLYALENEVESLQEHGSILQLERRNFLRFGKRDFPKRFSENDREELMEENYHHKSIPRSLLQEGKRPYDTDSKPNYDDDIPSDNDEMSYLIVKRGKDNFLRFGKRGAATEGQDIFLLKAFKNNDRVDKRSKDYLRFG